MEQLALPGITPASVPTVGEAKEPTPVTPLGDMVLIEQRREETSGLVLPSKLSEATKQAICTHWVVAMGPDCERELRAGQRVSVNPKAFCVKPVPGERMLVHEDDILAVIG